MVTPLSDKVFPTRSLMGFTIVASHRSDDHINLYLIIPPKYSVSYGIRVLKSKSASWLKKKTKRFSNGILWARGYCVSIIGINEQVIINEVRNQVYKRVDIERMKPFSSALTDKIETTSG